MYQAPANASAAVQNFITSVNELMDDFILASEKVDSMERVKAFVNLAEKYEVFSTEDAIALAMA